MTLTLQVTLRIASGHTVLAGSLANGTGAVSSQQLVLVSARLLEPPSVARDPAPVDDSQTKQ